MTNWNQSLRHLGIEDWDLIGNWDLVIGIYSNGVRVVYKLIVLTDPETAFGFRLGGVEVVEAPNPEEASKKLNFLLNEDTSGIIAVSEEFMLALDERTREKINRIDRPIVISIPLKKELEEVGERREYLSRLIRRAIGFDIKLR